MPEFTLPPLIRLAPCTVRPLSAVTAPPNVTVDAVTLVLPLKVTGPTKLKAPALVMSPSKVVIPVLMMRQT